MEDKEFDKLFSSLKEREINPSGNALKHLQEVLDKEERKIKRRKLKPIWWAAAVFLSVGIGVYNFNNKQLSPKIATSEPDLIENALPKELELYLEKPIEKIAKKTKEEPKVDLSLSESATIPSQLIAIKKIEKTPLVVKKEIELKEEFLLESVDEYDKKLADLLRPVETTELDMLLQSKQIALALEKLEDVAILELLREAQEQLQQQEDSLLVFDQANRLLQQAESELAANKSLKNILNKAIETGVVEVQALFKRK